MLNILKIQFFLSESYELNKILLDKVSQFFLSESYELNKILLDKVSQFFLSESYINHLYK